MTDTFLKVLKQRRSYYGLAKDIDVSSTRIQEIVEQATVATPSAFNSQSQRVVLLLGSHHDKLWKIVMETLRAVVPADAFSKTEERITAFASGAGSLLYFDDEDVTANLQRQFPLYADNFPIWAQQANGMLQSNIWNALEAEGLGVSLQHYNPLIDNALRAEWPIPISWKLIAQMPFGKIIEPVDGKEIAPIAERVKIFK